LIASRDDLDWAMMPADGVVAVSAAASTPESSVLGVVDSLRERFDVHMEERGSIVERTLFRPLTLS
jgi:4-hydroxy-3-methylbut-2-enyl diphosphate reductase IspH